MQTVKKILHDELMKQYEGKKVGYSTWDIEYATRKIMEDLFNKVGLDGKEIRAYKSGSRGWYISVSYKGYGILGIDVKRKKGDTHYSWYSHGNYADYTYKDFDITIFDEEHTLEDVVHKIDYQTGEQKKKADEKLALAKEVFKMIAEKIGAKDEWDTRNFISYMESKRYSLSE